jgi:hypothetical protein
MSGSWIIFHKSYLWQLPPEIWRLATSFLLTGPGFNFVFDLYFTWVYGTGLELNSPRFTQPGDFFTFVVFLAAVILVSNHLCTVSTAFITHLDISARPVTLLAGSVPEDEGDYPCGACSSVIRKNPKDCMWRRHGGGY